MLASCRGQGWGCGRWTGSRGSTRCCRRLWVTAFTAGGSSCTEVGVSGKNQFGGEDLRLISDVLWAGARLNFGVWCWRYEAGVFADRWKLGQWPGRGHRGVERRVAGFKEPQHLRAGVQGEGADTTGVL